MAKRALPNELGLVMGHSIQIAVICRMARITTGRRRKQRISAPLTGFRSIVASGARQPQRQNVFLVIHANRDLLGWEDHGARPPFT